MAPELSESRSASGEAGAGPAGSISRFSAEKPTEDLYHKNRLRQHVTYAIIAIFGLEVAAVILLFFKDIDKVEKVVQFVAILMTPTFTLLGSIMAFYFGVRSTTDSLFEK